MENVIYWSDIFETWYTHSVKEVMKYILPHLK